MGSLKAELDNAIVDGIRQRGPDAVGLLLVGLARLVVGATTLAALLGVGVAFGYDVTAGHFAALTGVSALVGWTAGAAPRDRGR